MKRLPLVLLCAAALFSQQLDPHFKERAFEHVRSLAAFGNRVAGSANDAKAVSYVKDKLEKLGLTVAVEPFDIRSFALDQAVIRIGKTTAAVEHLDFDPYAGAGTITGEAVLVTPEMLNGPLELAGKIAIAGNKVRFFALALRQPKAGAIVSPEDFDRLKAEPPGPARVEIRGREIKLASANVVGTLAREQAKGEIVVSAHLDSVDCPGAHDNASGVAVLLELARYYRGLEDFPFTIRFVTFGAEEIGRIGAKVYLDRHRQELERSALLFNMDSVGGPDGIYVEMRDGVRGLPAKQPPRDSINLAAHDGNLRWFRLGSPLDIAASNVPEWLQQAIRKTAEEQAVKIIPARGMGSDHKIFHQGGIVATNICLTGIKSHSPEDTPAQIIPESLEKAGRFVAGVLAKVP